MSKVEEYDKPPPYSPFPQEPVHQNYPVACQPYPQQQTGYQSFPTQPIPSGYPQNYGATSVTIQPQEIIIIGTCPACRVGVVEDDYPCIGILCAIFFFPLGLLCCLLSKNRRCSNCGAYFG